MFEELKTFISVVELKNFTRAGEHLNLSQPTVSTHIKNLENYFDVTLINRSVKQKNIFITESGYKLYERSKEIINLFEVTYMDVKNSSNTLKGSIKIGASLTIGEFILPDFLSYFSKKYPDIDIEILIENTNTICSLLKDLSIDIGLIEGPQQPGGFTQEYFLKDTMVLAYPYGAFSFDKEIDYSLLENQNWVIREDGSGTREFFNMFMQTNRITPKKLTVLGSNYAIKEAVKNNLGLTIISNLVTKSSVSNNELSIKSIGKSFDRYFSYITPNRITTTKAAEVFLSELKDYSVNKLTTK